MTNKTQLAAEFVRQIDETCECFEQNPTQPMCYEPSHPISDEHLELLKEFFSDKVDFHMNAFLSIYTQWQANLSNLNEEQFLKKNDGWFHLLKQPDMNNLSYMCELGFRVSSIDKQDYLRFRKELCSNWIKTLNQHSLFETPRIHSFTQRHDSFGSNSSFNPLYFDLNRSRSDSMSSNQSSVGSESRLNLTNHR